jgi:hypothetical protein
MRDTIACLNHSLERVANLIELGPDFNVRGDRTRVYVSYFVGVIRIVQNHPQSQQMFRYFL